LETNIVQGTQYTTDLFSWWVSNPILFLPTLIFGGLVVLKIRKWTPVLAFILAGLVMFLYESWKLDLPLGSEFIIYFLSWPTLFLAFFMLTEPFTMPPTKRTQIFYGALVALVANTTLFAPFIAMTPELALVIGNLAIYPYRIRQKLFLTFIEKREIAKNTFEFIFKKPAGFTYQAGQYLEWMLPHEKSDSRGVRRYFTIASSPTESVVRLALKFVPEGSSYKQKLQALTPGDVIVASQLAGDFMLPKDTHSKLAFIAGGIGVTPFSSHITYIKDTKADYDVQLFYCVNQLADLAYYDEFLQASETIKLEVIPLIAKAETEHAFETGYLTKEILERRTPDYKERMWYISGPPPMVSAYKSLLLKSGVARSHIVTDYFPGLA